MLFVSRSTSKCGNVPSARRILFRNGSNCASSRTKSIPASAPDKDRRSQNILDRGNRLSVQRGYSHYLDSGNCRSLPIAIADPFMGTLRNRPNQRPADLPRHNAAYLRVHRPPVGSGDVIELHLPMVPSVSRWHNHSLALMRGPIVFSLDPGQSWVKLRDRGLTADWQVYPEKFWNYALLVNENSSSQIEVVEGPIGMKPFAARATPVKLRVRARRIGNWRSEDGVAAPVPKGLQTSSLPEETLELIPYAAAKLRITAFPQLSESSTTPPISR